MWNRDYLRIQIFSIDQLLGGMTPDLPGRITTHKEANRVRMQTGKQERFDL